MLCESKYFVLWEDPTGSSDPAGETRVQVGHQMKTS